MGKKVSLMTFHASHNFGSVMQAYALKAAVGGMGNECSILNFRPASQLDKYSALPRTYGVRCLVKSAAQTLAHPRRRMRSIAQYEGFISRYLTDDPMVSDMSGLAQPDADVLLTGSDQVWGYQIPEFARSHEDIRPAYYFSFAEGRKVSYASSTGTATAAQLAPYAGLMAAYDRISVREREAVGLVSGLSGKPVECVLDPTFLLDVGDWRRLMSDAGSIDSVPAGRYCLIYSLQGLRARGNWLRLARAVQDELDMPLVSASHFVPLRGAGIRPTFDIGPTDVLALFANASYVLTDTFHGTLFSMHFGKQFVTYTPGRDDPRIRDITERLGLTSRVAHTVDEAAAAVSRHIDYGVVGALRSAELEASKRYLSDAIDG